MPYEYGPPPSYEASDGTMYKLHPKDDLFSPKIRLTRRKRGGRWLIFKPITPPQKGLNTRIRTRLLKMTRESARPGFQTPDDKRAAMERKHDQEVSRHEREEAPPRRPRPRGRPRSISRSMSPAGGMTPDASDGDDEGGRYWDVGPRSGDSDKCDQKRDGATRNRRAFGSITEEKERRRFTAAGVAKRTQAAGGRNRGDAPDLNTTNFSDSDDDAEPDYDSSEMKDRTGPPYKKIGLKKECWQYDDDMSIECIKGVGDLFQTRFRDLLGISTIADLIRFALRNDARTIERCLDEVFENPKGGTNLRPAQRCLPMYPASGRGPRNGMPTPLRLRDVRVKAARGRGRSLSAARGRAGGSRRYEVARINAYGFNGVLKYLRWYCKKKQRGRAGGANVWDRLADTLSTIRPKPKRGAEAFPPHCGRGGIRGRRSRGRKRRGG